MKSLQRVSLFLALFLPSIASSHPVTFEQGIVLMSQNSPDQNSIMFHYSYKYWASVGFLMNRINLHQQETYYFIPNLSFTLKRWNLDKAQANIYFTGGLGASLQNSEFELAGLARIQLDYETRTFFTALVARTIQGKGSQKDFNSVQYQIGFSPFKNSYDQLQTWIILNTRYEQQSDRKFDGGPFIRFFYKSVFWEIGSSIHGNWMLNIMTHI